MSTTPDDALGGRLPLLAPDDLTVDQRKLYAHFSRTLLPWAEQSGFTAATADGRVIGPFNPLLYSPTVGEGFAAYLAAERAHTSLSPRVREVIILTVGAVWQTAYELYAHAAVATKAGLDPATIDALSAGRTPDGLSDDESAAHAFARQLAADHRVDDATYQVAEKQFGPAGIVDLIHLVTLYMGTSALLNAFAIPVPKD